MGIDQGILRAMQDHAGQIQKSHFIFSTGDSIEKKEGKLSHGELLQHLRGAGYDAHELKGSKPGIVIYSVSPEAAEELHGLAKRLGQESSVYSTGEMHEKRYHSGEKAGKKVAGKGTKWYSKAPGHAHSSLPGNMRHFNHNFDDDIRKSEEDKNDVSETYKESADSHCDLLFKVKIKGEKELAEGIPLHMSVKIFNSMKEVTIEELKEAIKKYGIKAPDPKELKFEPVIFHSKESDEDYFMLKLHNCGDSFKKFYEHFKDRGVTYEKYFLHVTLNQALYDDIKENGLKPEEFEFGPLSFENGAGNTAHIFDEMQKAEMEKGIKHVAATLGVAGALAGAGKMQQPTQQAQAPKQQQVAAAPQQPKEASVYSPKRMLATIADVESSAGKDTQHRPLGTGERAYGKYALTPDVIRDTIHMNRDLKTKYKQGMSLKGQDLHNYMQDNPGLEDTIAQRHLSRLEHHFGQNPEKLGYAWLEGITGTYRADKEKKDIGSHWHVKKIRDAWNKEK